MDDPQAPKQLCTLRIMFPVESDEVAIQYKKKITEILAPIPEAQISFSLMNAPPQIKS